MFGSGNRFPHPNQGMFPSQPRLMTPMDFGAPPLGNTHLQPHFNDSRGPLPLPPPPPTVHHYGPPPPSQYRHGHGPPPLLQPPPPTAHHYGPPRPVFGLHGEQPHQVPTSFQDNGRNLAQQQNHSYNRANLIKPMPMRARSAMTKPSLPQKKRAFPELANERVRVYRNVLELLQEVQAPLRVSDPDLMDLFMDLSESLKHAINHQGGYRVFLQQSGEIEVKDGWVQIKQEDDETVECNEEVAQKEPQSDTSNESKQLKPNSSKATDISKNKEHSKEPHAPNFSTNCIVDKDINISSKTSNLESVPIQAVNDSSGRANKNLDLISGDSEINVAESSSGGVVTTVCPSSNQRPEPICSPQPVYRAGLGCIPGPVCNPVFTSSPERVCSPAPVDSLVGSPVCIQGPVISTSIGSIPDPICSPEPVSSPELLCSPRPLCSPEPVCSRGLVYTPGALGSPEPVFIQEPVRSSGPICMQVPVHNRGIAFNPDPVNSPELACSPGPVGIPQPVCIQGQISSPVAGPIYSQGFASSPQPVHSPGPICSPDLIGRPSSNSSILSGSSYNSSLSGSSYNSSTSGSSYGSSASGSSSMSVGIMISCPVPAYVGAPSPVGLIQNPVRFPYQSVPAFIPPPASAGISVSFGIQQPIGTCDPVRNPASSRSPVIVEIPHPSGKIMSSVDLPPNRNSQSFGSMMLQQNAPQGAVYRSYTPVAAPSASPPSANPSSDKRLQPSGPVAQKEDGTEVSVHGRYPVTPIKHPGAMSHIVPVSQSLDYTTKRTCVTASNVKSSRSKVTVDPTHRTPSVSLTATQRRTSPTPNHNQVSFSGNQGSVGGTKHHLNPKSSAFVPKMKFPNDGDHFDDSFLLAKYLPQLSSISPDKKLHMDAYRLLKEVFLRNTDLDIISESLLSLIIIFSQSERDYIKSIGGYISFMKKYAKMFHDEELLDVFAKKDRREQLKVELEARCKGTETDVVKNEHVGTVTDEIVSISSAVNAVVERVDSGVDTVDLELLVVKEHSQLMKKLALVGDRLAHERMRAETMKEKNDIQLKELKEKCNKESAKLQDLTTELNTSEKGGLVLQLQISRAQTKNCDMKLSEQNLLKERLIQELGQKTNRLLMLEQEMKEEAIRRACMVTVNKSTSTDNVKPVKQELDSQDRVLYERVQRAEIQILNMEHERKKEEVQDLLEKAAYTYQIFDMDLNVSTAEKAHLKGQWANYQARANQHLQALKNMVEHQKHVIESIEALDDIPDLEMPTFEPFTVLCQVSAGSPSDLHFVIAPPCQSCLSISSPNSGSQSTQGSSLKAQSCLSVSSPNGGSQSTQRSSLKAQSCLSVSSPNGGSQSTQRSSLKAQSCLSVSSPNGGSQSTQGSSLKAHSPQAIQLPRNTPTTIDTKLGKKLKIPIMTNSNMDYGRRSMSRKNRRLAGKKLDMTHGPSLQPAASEIQGMKSVQKKSNMEYLHDYKKYVELLGSTDLQSRLQSAMATSITTNGVHLKVNTSSILPDGGGDGGKLAKEIVKQASELNDPESADLDFLLESCWQLASTLPNNNSSVSQHVLSNNQDCAVSAPKGLSLPTQIPQLGVPHQDSLSSKRKQPSNVSNERSASKCQIKTTNNNISSYSTPVTSRQNQDADNDRTRFIQNIRKKQVASNMCDGSMEINMPEEVSSSHHINSESSAPPKRVANMHSSHRNVETSTSKAVDVSCHGSNETNMHKEAAINSHRSCETSVPEAGDVSLNGHSDVHVHISKDDIGSHVGKMASIPEKVENRCHDSSEINMSKEEGINSHSDESIPKEVDNSCHGSSEIIASGEGSSSRSSSETDIPKEVNLDISTATSSDTGIVDCSACSEPGDSKMLESNFQEAVANDKLYMLSDDERITVDVSPYKMSEREYLYQQDSSDVDNVWDRCSEDISKQYVCKMYEDTLLDSKREDIPLEDDVGCEQRSKELEKMVAVKQKNEELSSLFLPAYVSCSLPFSPDAELVDNEDEEVNEVDLFLPEWMKKSKTCFF